MADTAASSLWETSLKQIYLDTNPFLSGLAFFSTLMPVTYAASELTNDCSQIDRVWSMLPTIAILHWTVWAYLTGLSTGRLNALLIATTTWSIRLTYNTWRKGGYQKGSEDYRWSVVRKGLGHFSIYALHPPSKWFSSIWSQPLAISSYWLLRLTLQTESQLYGPLTFSAQVPWWLLWRYASLRTNSSGTVRRLNIPTRKPKRSRHRVVASHGKNLSVAFSHKVFSPWHVTPIIRLNSATG